MTLLLGEELSTGLEVLQVWLLPDKGLRTPSCASTLPVPQVFMELQIQSVRFQEEQGS